MSDDTYKVYAVRYGHHDRRSPENFLGGDPHDILQPGHRRSEPDLGCRYERYQAARPGLEGWVARLDADPGS